MRAAGAGGRPQGPAQLGRGVDAGLDFPVKPNGGGAQPIVMGNGATSAA